MFSWLIATAARSTVMSMLPESAEALEASEAEAAPAGH